MSQSHTSSSASASASTSSASASSSSSTSSTDLPMPWNLGPDTLHPADSFTTTDINKAVKLRLNVDDLKAYPPISIYSQFKRIAFRKPNHHALAFKSDPAAADWKRLTYYQYWQLCNRTAKSFIHVNIADCC